MMKPQLITSFYSDPLQLPQHNEKLFISEEAATASSFFSLRLIWEELFKKKNSEDLPNAIVTYFRNTLYFKCKTWYFKTQFTRYFKSEILNEMLGLSLLEYEILSISSKMYILQHRFRSFLRLRDFQLNIIRLRSLINNRNITHNLLILLPIQRVKVVK